MWKCSNCQTENNDNFEFCSSCGHRKSNYSEKDIFSKAIIIGIAALVAIAVIVVIIVALVKQTGSKSGAETEYTPSYVISEPVGYTEVPTAAPSATTVNPVETSTAQTETVVDEIQKQEETHSDESAQTASVDDVPFEWKNVKQYYYECADYDYMIAVLKDGTMKVCNPCFDFFNERFCAEISSMTNVDKFVPIKSSIDGIILAIIDHEGSLKVICSNDEPSDSVQKIINSCSDLKHVNDVVYGCDDNQGVFSLYALQGDGTVVGIGDYIQQEVSSWDHIIAIESFTDFNIVAVKENNTCVAAGNAFKGTNPPAYCGEIFDVSKLKDIFDVESILEPWGVDLYFWSGGYQGNVIHYGISGSSTQPILNGMKSLKYAGYDSCLTYALGQDGSLYEISATDERITKIADSGVKSLGPSGLALNNDGTVYMRNNNSEYVKATPSVIAGAIPSNGLKSIDYSTYENEYFALTEDNTICKITLS